MKTLGSINIDGEYKTLSVEKDGNIRKYYLGDQIIGARDPDVMGDKLIAFIENLENKLSEKIRDEITQVIENDGKDEILKTEEKREQDENFYEQKKDYEREIGEDIGNKEIKDEKTKKDEDIDSLEETENTTGKIDIEQTVDMDAKVTYMNSMGKRLEKAGIIKGSDEKKGKLGIVKSDQLNNLKDENGNNLQGQPSGHGAVVITKEKGEDGEPIVRPLNLKNDSQAGTNPTGRVYQVRQDGTVGKGDGLTRLEIQGQETLEIKKGDCGKVEVYHSSGKTKGGKGVKGNQPLNIQVETSDSKKTPGGTNQATQKLAQELQDGDYAVQNSYEEAKRHENDNGEPCKDMTPEDLDGDPNTSSHNHIDDTVSKLMENENIAEKFTKREVTEMVKEAWEKRSDGQTLEEFQKEVGENIEYDAQHMHGAREK